MACNHSGPLRVQLPYLKKRIAVVGNGNVEVGTKSPTPKPDPLKTGRPRNCGAMLQQCADSGSFSAPQKFVRLVGCRDSSVRPAPAVRPRQAE
jgi:hypothetical protein